MSSSTFADASSSFYGVPSSSYPLASSSSYPPYSSSFSRTVGYMPYKPLTTVFTPPFQCRDTPYTFIEQHSGTITAQRNADGAGERNATDCYPPGFKFPQSSNGTVQYSPGVCPAGYTAASKTRRYNGGAWTSWCCPRGMNYSPDRGCYTSVSAPTTVLLNAQQTITMSGPFVAADWGIQVAWATSDLNKFTPQSAPILTRLERNGAEDPDDGGAGYDNSALMVGIPVSVVTFAVVAVACYALWRKKRRQTRGGPTLLSDGEDESIWSTADYQHRRYDSAQVQTTSSDDTPTTQTGTTPMTQNGTTSPFTAERQNLYVAARQENWRDDFHFDETQPETVAR